MSDDVTFDSHAVRVDRDVRAIGVGSGARGDLGFSAETADDLDGFAKERVAKTATIARRSPEEAEFTDSTCTPPWLTEMLPSVDFDPCSNDRSTVKARISMTLDNGLDGLVEPWIGTGFQNNPFSSPIAWMKKAAAELGSGRCTGLIILCKLDPGTKWWHVAQAADDLAGPPEIWHFLQRVQYVEHPTVIEKRRIDQAQKLLEAGRDPIKATGKSQANFNSVILHHRGRGATRMAPLQLERVATRWVSARGAL